MADSNKDYYTFYPEIDTNWNHLVLAWDGSILSCYKNSVQIGSKSVSSMDVLGNQDEIGTNSNNSTYSDNSISDVRVYDRALSSSEIEALYELGNADMASPPTDGVSYYPFDGDATDSWGSNDGTVNGATSTDGIRGQAYSFDGTDDYIQTSWTNGPFPFTVSFWYNEISHNDYGRVIEFGDYNNNYGFQINQGPNSNRLDFAIGNGSSGNYIGKIENIFKWTHISYMADSTTKYLFKNGILYDKISDSTTISYDSNPLTFASDSNALKDFSNCMLDDVRIYDRALEPWEIQEIYRYGTRGKDLAWRYSQI